MIFHLKEAQNLIAEHYKRDFDMIFHFDAAKNFVAEHEERDFELFFNLRRLKMCLQSTMKEILT